jgi:hypothetical protein
LKPCFSVEECLRGFEVRRRNGEESLKLFCDRRRETEKKKWKSSKMQKVK